MRLSRRADDGLSDTETVDAVAEISIALVSFSLRVSRLDVGRSLFVNLEGEGHAALEIEPELQRALGAAEEFGQEDVVALLDILQGFLQADAGEILRKSRRRSLPICLSATKSLEAWPAWRRVAASSSSLANSAVLAVASALT
jgi:hypothetical protein